MTLREVWSLSLYSGFQFNLSMSINICKHPKCLFAICHGMCCKSSVWGSRKSGDLQHSPHVISDILISVLHFCIPNIYSLGTHVQKKTCDHPLCRADVQPAMELDSCMDVCHAVSLGLEGWELVLEADHLTL